MKRALCIVGLFVLSLLVTKNSFANTHKLLGMSNSRKADMNRISLIMDRIPDFEVEKSGQRVSVLLPQTSIAPTFREIPADELLPPLVQVKTDERAGDSTVEFYFRKVPGFVDVAVDPLTAGLNVNVFWNQEESGARPGIMGQRFGHLKPIKGGAVAKKVISSDFSGNWIAFFKEYERPPEIRMPERFSFPGFPSPMIAQHMAFLPPEVRKAGMEKAWTRAASRVSELILNDENSGNSDPYRLLLSEFLLRGTDADGAIAALDPIKEENGQEWISCWKTYFLSYALAASGRYYQAGNRLAEQMEMYLRLKALAPWVRILRAEIHLATGRPEQALEVLNRDVNSEGRLIEIETLRKADALFQLGDFEKASALYAELSSRTDISRQYPASMANWSAVLYNAEEFARAADQYFVLSEELKDLAPKDHALALYWSAMSRLRAGNQKLAMSILSECHEKHAGTEAGFRSWMKLIDLDLLHGPNPPHDEILAEYDVIIEDGPDRQLREEAFFKRILASHLSGDDLGAVTLLGQFFDDCWAGDLYPESQALFVEIFPKVIEDLINQKAYVPALALVARHRDLLAEAPITFGFLNSLAESYSNAGFLEQAAVSYRYILDFEKDRKNRMKAFLPLIRLYFQQNKYEHVLEYASEYLDTFPEGEDREEILYCYADALYRTGDTQGTIRVLHENSRPVSPELDTLTGNVFFDTGQFELSQYYYSRAADADERGGHPELRLKRAEAFFNAKALRKAIPLYESLIDVPRFGGQAGYRLILIYFEEQRKSEALKIYEKMTEMDVGKQWLEMAGEMIRIKDALNGEL